jgi:N-acetylmuramoyl-L-alanine amidase
MRFQARGRFESRAFRAVLATITFALCLLAAAPRLLALELQEIRFWSLGEVTRVVVQFDGEFRYKWARLENPPRVFFDLPDARLAVDGAKERGRMRVIPVNDSTLKQIRYAENTPGSSRVVLDLAGDHEFTASQLANPPRLIIEIRNAAGATGIVEQSRTGVVRPGAPPEPGSAVTPGNPQPTDARVPEPVASTSVRPPLPSSLGTAPAASTSSASVTRPASAPAPSSKPGAEAAAAAGAPSRTRQPEPVVSAVADASPASPAVPATPVDRAPAPAVASAAPENAAPEKPEPVPVAKPAARTATGQQSLTRALGLKIGKIVLDPGHGGKDQGTAGISGLLEKDLVLDLAKRVKALLEVRLGSEVVLTREDDVFIALEERTAIANRHRADLFVSLHANSSPFRLAAGPETYYLDFTSSRESMDVAARENATSNRSVADLQDLVKKIALKDKRDESRDFAARMQRALFQSQAVGSPGKKRNRGVKAAPFVVLVGAEMPSILVEIGFLSNKQEEGALKKEAYRQAVAEAIFEGMNSYIASLSHFDRTERAAREE